MSAKTERSEFNTPYSSGKKEKLNIKFSESIKDESDLVQYEHLSPDQRKIMNSDAIKSSPLKVNK